MLRLKIKCQIYDILNVFPLVLLLKFLCRSCIVRCISPIKTYMLERCVTSNILVRTMLLICLTTVFCKLLK